MKGRKSTCTKINEALWSGLSIPRVLSYPLLLTMLTGKAQANHHRGSYDDYTSSDDYYNNCPPCEDSGYHLLPCLVTFLLGVGGTYWYMNRRQNQAEQVRRELTAQQNGLAQHRVAYPSAAESMNRPPQRPDYEALESDLDDTKADTQTAETDRLIVSSEQPAAPAPSRLTTN